MLELSKVISEEDVTRKKPEMTLSAFSAASIIFSYSAYSSTPNLTVSVESLLEELFYNSLLDY